jgi:hypothetical protein
MTRYERRQFFERLCELRALYARRGSDDATSVVTIDQAIADAAILFESGLTVSLISADGEERPARSDQTGS